MKKNSDDKSIHGDQSQGGISHKVAQQAHDDPHPERAGLPGGNIGKMPYTPQTSESLDTGDDGDAPYGFTGDDGAHVPGNADSSRGVHNNPDDDGRAEQGGTGQGQPHHGYDDRLGNDPSIDSQDEPDTGADTQLGGTREDREQRVEERKDAQVGAGAKHRRHDGLADAAPGAAPPSTGKR